MRATPVRSVPARIARQLERAHELNPRLNAFTHLYSPQGALALAAVRPVALVCD